MMRNELAQQFETGLLWRESWGLRLRLMDANNRMPRNFPASELKLTVDGKQKVGFMLIRPGATESVELDRVLDIPLATLKQLDLHDAAFGDDFKPAYCAMDDGLDRPGGCWHLFEDRPSFDPLSLQWQSNGDSWEIGLDPSTDLHDTPEFQRWVKPGFSLVRIVQMTDIEPSYHPVAMMAAEEKSASGASQASSIEDTAK